MILGISGLAGSGKDQTADFLTKDFGVCKVALADPLKRIARDIYAFTDEQLWGPSANRNAPDLRYPRPHSWNWTRTGSNYEKAQCSCCGTETMLQMLKDEVWAPFEQNIQPCHLTPRYCLQRIGTELGRNCYPETWAVLAVRTAQRLLIHPDAGYDQKRGFFLSDGKHPVPHVAIPDIRFRNEIQSIREAGGKIIRVKRPGAGLKGSVGLHLSEVEQASIPDTEFDALINNDGTLDELRKNPIV